MTTKKTRERQLIAERRQSMRGMGLPEAWDGDPAGIARFLGFVEQQLGTIIFNSPADEYLWMRLQGIRREAELAKVFAEGFMRGKLAK